MVKNKEEDRSNNGGGGIEYITKKARLLFFEFCLKFWTTWQFITYTLTVLCDVGVCVVMYSMNVCIFPEWSYLRLISQSLKYDTMRSSLVEGTHYCSRLSQTHALTHTCTEGKMRQSHIQIICVEQWNFWTFCSGIFPSDTCIMFLQSLQYFYFTFSPLCLGLLYPAFF